MKILVDKIPNNKECPFSYWVSYPPIIEKPGEYYCSKVEKICNSSTKSTECYYLKELKNE